MKFFIYFCLFFSFNIFHAQNFGASLGVSLNFGTHIGSIGVNSNLFYQDYFYQLNLGIQSNYTLYSLAKRKYFAETRIAFGGVLLAGKKENSIDFQHDGLLHNTRYNYGLGFNYLWYFDEIGTSQKSGAWSIHAKKVSILFENDVFGGQARDRFRSGILQVSYRDSLTKYFSNLYIWTGETRNSEWNKTVFKDCPNGYRSLENLAYGKTSHGIVNFGITRKVILNSRFQNNLTLKTGLDSEQIRHIFQNKISHDLILLPKSYKRNTPHYPRLDKSGCPVFEKSEMRKNKLYFQFALNEVPTN